MLKFVNLKRRSGKTTMLIHTAYVTGYPIITGTTQMRDILIEQAYKKMGLEGVNVFTLHEWIEISRHATTVGKVLIDEAESIIDYALRELLQAEVVAASFSIPMIELPTADKENKEVKDNADN